MENKKETIDLLARKKILIICHTLSMGGGSEKVLNTLIHELAVSFDIDIIERLEDCSCVYKLPSNVTRLKSMSYTQNYLKAHNIKWSFGALFRRRLLSFITILFPSLIYSFYINRRYDYEISFNYLYSAYLIANSPNGSSKKIMWNHGDHYDLDYKQYSFLKRCLYYFYYKMQNSAFMRADRIVVISKKTKDSIDKLYPKSISKIELIHNGYDLNRIYEKSLEYNVAPSSHRYRIISVGRLDENKNVRLQIEAVKDLIEQGLDIELLIIGKGEQEKILREEAAGYMDKISFVGFIENPYPYISSANALLLTSFSEGFPTVIIEALALGIPVISTPVGGADELILDGVNGKIVNRTKDDVAIGIRKIVSLELDKMRIKDSVNLFTKESWGENIKRML